MLPSRFGPRYFAMARATGRSGYPHLPPSAPIEWISTRPGAGCQTLDMLDANWGSDRAEGRFHRVEHYHYVDSDDPAFIPEVRAAQEHGYELADEAPLWCFLPAVWPDHARAWIRDTRARSARISCHGEPSERVPWTAADYAEVESDINELLRECSIPERPAGRLWLLKPPPGHRSIRETLDYLASSAESAGIPFMASAEFAAQAQQELKRLFQTND